MLTRDEIDAESQTIDATTIEMVMTEIRSSSHYKANPGLFSDLRTKLTAASGTVQGAMVNAVVTKLSGIGEGIARLEGGSDGLHYDQKEAKEVWRAYLLNLFYDIIEGTAVDVSQLSIEELLELGLLSGYKAGQRDAEGEFI